MDSIIADARGQSDRYRKLASAIRGTLSIINNSEVREELWLLAAQYEELARHIEARRDEPTHSNSVTAISPHLPLPRGRC
jgi:hypothetical protein